MEDSMSEDKTTAKTEAVSESPATETPQSSPNDELIAESKKYRKRAQDAEKALEKIKTDAKSKEEKALAEQGKFEKLWERDKADAEWARDYRENRKATLIERHPEEDRERLSKFNLEDLEFYTNKLSDKEKTNAKEVAGTARTERKEVPKDIFSLSPQERKKVWPSYMENIKANKR